MELAALQLDVRSAILTNRMMSGIASRVRGFVGCALGVTPREAEPSDIEGHVDLLVVGRQHLPPQGGMRYGYEVVEEAVRRGRPRLCFYVVPARLSAHLHAKDIEVLERVARTTRVYVLEFARLHELELDDAAARARRVLAEPWTTGDLPRLLGD